MGQITVDFCDHILNNSDAGKHSPLTVWEEKQLALAWLEREEARKECAQLMTFYQVSTLTELVLAQNRHIEKLQVRIPHSTDAGRPQLLRS
ncbi:MAG: hypothetical protein KGJ21_09945 [Pseudomonadota bacterium]|nr:hypothetical protein [Pseudomonadota bacterium]